MNDALEIANLKARYCATADLSASDPVASRAIFPNLFVPDVVADYGYGPLNGVEAAMAFLCEAIAGNSEWMIHFLASPLIEVAGDKAKGEWAVTVHSKRRDTGEVAIVIGRYADEFVRTGEGWRIARVGFAQLG